MVFGEKGTQLQHAFGQLHLMVGLGLSATQGRSWSEQCAMVSMHSYMFLRSTQNDCHIGAMLPLSTLAVLSKYKDGYSRAGSTDYVSSSQKVITYTKQ